MKQELRSALQSVFDQVTDYANSLEEAKYVIQEESRNSSGEILLELVCSREQFLQKLQQNDMREWSCSIDDASNKLQIMQALFHSSADILVWVDSNGLHGHHYQTLLSLLEQEAKYLGVLGV